MPIRRPRIDFSLSKCRACDNNSKRRSAHVEIYPNCLAFSPVWHLNYNSKEMKLKLAWASGNYGFRRRVVYAHEVAINKNAVVGSCVILRLFLALA